MARIARTPQEIAQLLQIYDHLSQAGPIIHVVLHDGGYLDGVVKGIDTHNEIASTGGPHGEQRPVGHSMTLRLLWEDGSRTLAIDLFEIRYVVSMWQQKSQDYAQRGLI